MPTPPVSVEMTWTWTLTEDYDGQLTYTASGVTGELVVVGQGAEWTAMVVEDRYSWAHGPEAVEHPIGGVYPTAEAAMHAAIGADCTESVAQHAETAALTD